MWCVEGGSISNYFGILKFRKCTKEFYLVDTYKGIPLSTLNGHEKAYAIEHNRSNYHEDVYALVQQRFAKYPNVHLVRGAVPDVLTTLDNSIS